MRRNYPKKPALFNMRFIPFGCSVFLVRTIRADAHLAQERVANFGTLAGNTTP